MDYIKERAGVQPIGRTEKLYSRFALCEVCENQPLSLHISRNRLPWKITRAPVGKADAGDYFALFEPLSLQFFERLER